MKDNYRLIVLVLLILVLVVTWLVRRWKNKRLMQELDQKFQEGLQGRSHLGSLGQNLERIAKSRELVAKRVSASAPKPKP